MHRVSRSDFLALVILWGAIGYCWTSLLPPARALLEYLINPAYYAMVAATLSAVAYSAICFRAINANPWRQRLLAAFLAGMPLIYLWAAIGAGDHADAFRESVGLLVFVSLAVFGYRRSPLVVGAGITAHGIAWDLWHHHRATFIEPWYPVGCLVVDLAFFIAVALHEFGARSMAHPAGGLSASSVSDAA